MNSALNKVLSALGALALAGAAVFAVAGVATALASLLSGAVTLVIGVAPLCVCLTGVALASSKTGY